MQLIAESYDVLRSVAGLEPAELAQVFRGWNGGELESYLIEITARGPRPRRRRHRPAVRRRRGRRGRAEGHRPLDRAVRARPRGAGHRHRRGGVRPVAVGPASPAGRGCRAAGAGAGGPASAVAAADRERLVERRGAGALRLQDRRLRPGLRPDRRGQRRVRLGHRPRRHGHHLAGRLHHPGPVPRPAAPGLRRRPRAPDPARRPVVRRRPRRRTGRVAPGGGDGGRGRACPRRASPRRWPTTTPCAAQRLPAALVQGLRDLFGAHTYRRVDREGTFHTRWSGDGLEEER